MGMFFLFPLASTLSSLSSTVASLFLFVWISRLHKSLRGRLIARQLWHLALADFLASGLLFPWYALATVRAAYGQPFGDEYEGGLSMLCRVGHMNNIAYMTSVFIELHIAVTAITTILRQVSVLGVLSKLLPLVWVIGFMVGGAVEWFADVTWDAESGVCNPRGAGEKIKAYTMAGVLVICTFIYVGGMALARRRHGGTVEGRAWRRASVFIVAALVTWVPFVIYVFRPNQEQGIVGGDLSSRRWYYIMSVFLEANGLFNMMVYARQSGFLRKQQSRAQYIEDALETTTALPSRVSFNVGFKSWVDVSHVPALTEAANAAAAAEVRDLQESAKLVAAQKSRQCSLDSLPEQSSFLPRR